MKKLLFVFALCASQTLSAQQYLDNYVLKVQTGMTYSPLTSGTNITSGLLWDEENFKIPMGFTAKIGDSATSDFSLATGYGFVAGSDTEGVVNSFFAFLNLDLEDRGWISGTPASPIRYVVSGTAPNRIFKMELFNAGFYNEQDIYSSLDDSINLQTWVYETSNIVEIRFGASKISHPSDYYFFGTGLAVGYVKDADLNSGDITKLYTLTGSASAPTLDSTTDIISTTPNALNDYPAAGTVYRFIPKETAASVGEVNLSTQLSVFPTQATTSLTVQSQLSEAAQARIFTISGQNTGLSTALSKGNNLMDISGLSAGNYIVEISNGSLSSTFKFVKQ